MNEQLTILIYRLGKASKGRLSNDLRRFRLEFVERFSLAPQRVSFRRKLTLHVPDANIEQAVESADRLSEPPFNGRRSVERAEHLIGLGPSLWGESQQKVQVQRT
jgi:hypothetical protein